MGSVRAAHEAFVTGHSGTDSPMDVILAVSSAFPASVLSVAMVQGRVGWQWFALDCLILVTPVALGFTILADHTPLMFLVFTTLAALAVGATRPSGAAQERRHTDDEKKEGSGRRVGCVTSFRALLNLATTIAILAVDFHCFPRRFAKTEVQGYSIMDVGAAGFVVANGLVESRRQVALRVVARDVAVLMCLGVVRLAMVWASDYQHHVTEYGVHGNFFFTLAAIKLTCSWWAWRVGRLSAMILLLVLTYAHHLLLTVGGVGAWTLGPAPRDTLVSANREWLVSLPSYVALYLFGAALGALVCDSDRSKRARVPLFLWCVVAVSAVSLALLHTYVDPPSRRLGNAAFVAFSVLYATITLAIFSLCDLWLPKWLPGTPSTPALFTAINRRPLLSFLLSNLTTGLVNKSINTLDVQHPWDFCVVLTHTFGVLAVVYFLYKGDGEGRR